MIRLDISDSVNALYDHERCSDSNHWYSAALEIGVSLADMHVSTKPNITEQRFLLGVRDQIMHLFNFGAAAFALVDEQSNDFRFSECLPAERGPELMKEVNRRIDDGHFGWTLSQSRPAILPTQSREVMLLMCTLATRSRVHGMFVGLFSSPLQQISEAALNLLLIVLTNTSSALESMVLYRMVRQKNSKLEMNIRERTRELAVAIHNAEAANRAKSAFITNMSHEICTPLTSIIGYADLLRQGLVPDADRSAAIDGIVKAGHHLILLVDELLDMSKIEAGRIEIDQVNFDFPQLLADVESIIAPAANEKGLSFHSDKPASIPSYIYTDPLRLRHILLSLLRNAVKFTKSGGISLRVRVRDTDRTLEIEVMDTGIGIPKDYRDVLSQPFRQGDKSFSRPFGDTGLDLYLSRQYASLLGGELILDKYYAVGTRFRLSLPLTNPADMATTQDTPNLEDTFTPRGKLRGRVLVTDDTTENRHLIGLYLHAIGPDLAVETAINGEEAVERALRQPYDLILMDWQMPELDGLSATRLLRKAGYRNAIAALIDSATPEDRARCTAAGCDDFVTKPIEEEQLSRVLHRHLQAADALMPLQADIHDMPDVQALRDKFLSELRQRLEGIQQAFARHDFEELATAAHKLRDTGGSFGYATVSESASVLERAARAGDDMAVRFALEALEMFVDGATPVH